MRGGGAKEAEASASNGVDALRARGGDFWPRVPEEGAQLWERLPDRPEAAVSPQGCHMSRCSVTVLDKPFPRDRLGRCFRRRSDGSSGGCAALGPRGKRFQLEEEKWNRAGGGSPLLIRNFPRLP